MITQQQYKHLIKQELLQAERIKALFEYFEQLKNLVFDAFMIKSQDTQSSDDEGLQDRTSQYAHAQTARYQPHRAPSPHATTEPEDYSHENINTQRERTRLDSVHAFNQSGENRQATRPTSKKPQRTESEQEMVEAMDERNERHSRRFLAIDRQARPHAYE